MQRACADLPLSRVASMFVMCSHRVGVLEVKFSLSSASSSQRRGGA